MIEPPPPTSPDTVTDGASPADPPSADPLTILVLGGGNALGAYQAGAYAALHRAGVRPDWIVGTSVGAVNTALIAGNAPDDRLAALHAYWAPSDHAAMRAIFPAVRRFAGAADALRALLFGQPNTFLPNAISPWGTRNPTLFDTRPLGASLARLVDFDRLNDGAPRVTITAVDAETAQDAIFSTDRQRLVVDHVRASAALIPLFPPVEIDGRHYVDGGFSANLALDPVLSVPPQRPCLCIAIDLMPAVGVVPSDLDGSIARASDILFAAQSRRTIAAHVDAYHRAGQPGAGITLVHLDYREQRDEIGIKALDFSPASIAHRWAQGDADMERVLARLADGRIPRATRGLAVHRLPD